MDMALLTMGAAGARLQAFACVKRRPSKICVEHWGSEMLLIDTR